MVGPRFGQMDQTRTLNLNWLSVVKLAVGGLISYMADGCGRGGVRVCSLSSSVMFCEHIFIFGYFWLFIYNKFPAYLFKTHTNEG